MGMYLCYDIRGIQSFIFQIPKLKYIIGGSALVDQFDRETAPLLFKEKVEHLYSGGGRGAYWCPGKGDVNNLQESLRDEAYLIGVDIRFGRNKELSEASENATELYSFTPELFPGEPCPASGLYPVPCGTKIHETVAKRISRDGDRMPRYFEKRLQLVAPLEHPGMVQEKMVFFHNVNARDLENPKQGRRGAKALGNRNRWAVICMDGNGIGMQFQAKKEQTSTAEDMVAWVKAMSQALDTCSTKAVSVGVQRVISKWAGSDDFDPDPSEEQVMPIRPIVVGGDDIIVLCHVSYAMVFVKEAMAAFRTTSAVEQKKASQDLWPATNGEISISAGVLYCPVSLPLHTAIGYAESLLANAKAEGRRKKKQDDKGPSPESVDWEHITDSIIDTPNARRERELLFVDGDDKNKTVKLTTRPCTFSAYEEIEKLSQDYQKVPNSIRHEVLRGLRQGYSDRLVYVAELSKHQPELAGDLAEVEGGFSTRSSRWKPGSEANSQQTDVFDALMLLEEQHRMEEETNHG